VKSVLGEFRYGVSIFRDKGSLLSQIWGPPFWPPRPPPTGTGGPSSGSDCWSLLRNNNTAINLQTFGSSYSSTCFSACYHRALTAVFFTTYFFQSTWVSRSDYEKSR